MREGGQPVPPTIVVLCSGDRDPAAAPLRQLLAGIEEEGVPYEVASAASAGAGALAAEASLRSTLAVGVGVADDGAVAVTHRTLPAEQPVVVVDAGADDDAVRSAGRTAARVVVGLPLDGSDRLR